MLHVLERLTFGIRGTPFGDLKLTFALGGVVDLLDPFAIVG